jgi:hypothetical protein
MGSLRLIDNAAIWTAGIPNGWQLVQLKHVVTKLNRVPNEDDRGFGSLCDKGLA